MTERVTAPQVSIKKVPVIPFRVSVMCDCGGEFIFNGPAIALHPRVYQHKCNQCGYELQLLECFPKTVYEEIPDGAEDN